MELIRLSLRGITSFTSAQPVVIDFDSFGEGLIAFVGKNGAGKTSLIESVVASLFEEFPSRPGTLYQCAHGRDAFIETVWREDGHAIVARIQIDAEKRTSEKNLFVDGQAITSGRAKEFAVEIGARFGSLDLLLASVFMSLRSRGNFLLLPKGQRKELFAELLGLGHLSALSEACGTRRKTGDQEVTIQRALLTARQEEVTALLKNAAPESLRADGEELERTHRDTKLRLASLREQESDLIGKLERARVAEEELQGLRDAFAQAELDCARLEHEQRETADRGTRDIAQIEEQLTAWISMRDRLIEQAEADVPDSYVARRRTLNQRIDAFEAILAEEPSIVKAAEDLEALSAEQSVLLEEELILRDLTAECAQARMSVTHGRNMLTSAEVARRSLTTRRDALLQADEAVDADQARIALTALNTEMEQIGKADEQYADLKRRHTQAQTALAIATQKLSAASTLRDQEFERLTRAAGHLAAAPCTASERWANPQANKHGSLEMDRLPTPESKNLRSIAYEPIHGTLLVEFTTGACYRIDSVSFFLWQQFKDAPSKGSFYAKTFKKSFGAVKIDSMQLSANGNGDGLVNLSELCPLLSDARQAHIKLQAFTDSPVNLECKACEVLEEEMAAAMTVLVEELALAEEQSQARRTRLGALNREVREAHAVIAREAMVADRKQELAGINLDLEKDPIGDLTVALADALKHLEDFERRLAVQKDASAERKRRLLEIEEHVAMRRRQVARQSLVADAKNQIPVFTTELEGLAAQEQAELTLLDAKKQDADQQVAQCEAQVILIGARVLSENEQAKERLVAATFTSRARSEALLDAQNRHASFAGLKNEREHVRQLILLAEEQARNTYQAIMELQATIAEYTRRSSELEVLERQANEAAHQVALWGMLETALGKDGVQALEIDAAGPEVARLANELLESCYGSPRFSIQFETLREKTSKRGEYREVFDVRVFDRGQERDVALLSSGESVVVGESIGLALAIYNARKNKIRYRILFRDETVGPLDPENAQAYLTMLRRAMVLGGFKQALFVAHPPEVWRGADTCLFVENGSVSIQ